MFSVIYSQKYPDGYTDFLLCIEDFRKKYSFSSQRAFNYKGANRYIHYSDKIVTIAYVYPLYMLFMYMLTYITHIK